MVSGDVGRVIHVGTSGHPVAVALAREGDLEITHVTPGALEGVSLESCDAVVWSQPTRHDAIVAVLGAKSIHELGNHIGAVLAYSELLSRADLDEVARSDLQRLREAAFEAVRVLRQRPAP